MKLTKRTEIKKPEIVYNLHIENDHNYIANGAVVENCHCVQGNVLKNMLIEYGNNAAVRIGLTGTLPKDPAERMAVHYVLGDVIYEVPARELIDKGWLATLKLQVWELVENLTGEWNFFREKKPEEAAQTTYKKFKKEFLNDYPAGIS